MTIKSKDASSWSAVQKSFWFMQAAFLFAGKDLWFVMGASHWVEWLKIYEMLNYNICIFQTCSSCVKTFLPEVRVQSWLWSYSGNEEGWWGSVMFSSCLDVFSNSNKSAQLFCCWNSFVQSISCTKNTPGEVYWLYVKVTEVCIVREKCMIHTHGMSSTAWYIKP